MIPSLSPPTDNLYKFIALFGLGILILAIINISTNRDELVQSKVEVEIIQAEIFDSISHYQPVDINREKAVKDEVVYYEHVDKMFEKLDELETFVFTSQDIPNRLKGHIATQIDIIEIKSSISHQQERLNNFLIIIAVTLILFGFIFWYLKEQKWNDLQLRIKALKAKDESLST